MVSQEHTDSLQQQARFTRGRADAPTLRMGPPKRLHTRGKPTAPQAYHPCMLVGDMVVRDPLGMISGLYLLSACLLAFP